MTGQLQHWTDKVVLPYGEFEFDAVLSVHVIYSPQFGPQSWLIKDNLL